MLRIGTRVKVGMHVSMCRFPTRRLSALRGVVGVLPVVTMLVTVSGCAELDASVRSVTGEIEGLLGSESVENDEASAARAESAYARAISAREKGDDTGAVPSLHEAAELGHPRAAYELGIAYTRGRGVPVDLDAGAEWINRAADLGNANAQFVVGTSLYAGVGVERDVPRGLEYLERAADRGHARAQFLVGQAYVDGVGVTSDPAWAARWYGQAALAGHVQAQYAYGVMFATGFGVPRSDVSAYQWLSIAAARGDGDARMLLDHVAPRLTAAEIGAAESRANAFRVTRSAGLEDAPTIMFVQQRLTVLGFRVGPVDGIPGPRTRAAIRAYQSSQRLTADGKVSRGLLEQLRAGR